MDTISVKTITMQQIAELSVHLVKEMGMTQARIMEELEDIEPYEDERIFFEVPIEFVMPRLLCNAIGRELRIKTARLTRKDKDEMNKHTLILKLVEILNQLSWLLLTALAESEEQFSEIAACDGIGIRLRENNRVVFVEIKQTNPLKKFINLGD